MEVRRTGRYAGVWRLYCPRRRCYSVRLWFSEERAQRAARRWEAEQRQRQLFNDA